MNENSTAKDLSLKIMEMVSQLDALTLDVAIEYLKEEFKEYI